MATINASVSISSNIMSYPISINKTMTMKKQQSCNGLDETSGLRTKKFVNTDDVAVIEADEYTSSSSKAHKVYMRNTSSDKANFFYVAMHANTAEQNTDRTIGKLYGQDWMLLCYSGTTNITVASNTTDTQYLEYMVFADGMAS